MKAMSKTRTRCPLRVEYEDQHLMVVFKPAGVLSQGDRTGDPSIVDYAKQYLRNSGQKQSVQKGEEPYVGLIHRIDRPASGLLLIAKTKRAAELLSRLMRNNKIRKKYIALVHGAPENKKGRFEDYVLEKDADTVTKVVKKETVGAKKAELEYEVINSKGGLSLLSVTLITGRKHQIRAQFSHRGMPIVGDLKYSKSLKDGSPNNILLHTGEIALCANYISFPHPLLNGKIIEVRSVMPEWAK
ncbi:MAG: RluA family pseudouridine synthase [Pseudomonadota bacterium]